MMDFLNRFFNNIGKTIKGIARFTLVAGTIYVIVTGLISILEFGAFGITTIITGIVSVAFASIVLYGFGHLIEKVEEIADNTRYR